MRLGEALRRERLRQRIPLIKAATLAGMSQEGLSHIESGRTTVPKWSTVTALARVLNVSLDKLERMSRQ